MEQRVLRYLERNFAYHTGSRSQACRPDYVCLECRKVTRSSACCGKRTYTLNHILRVPRSTASKSQWGKFLQRLVSWPYNAQVHRENALRS